MTSDQRSPIEASFETQDGVSLFYRYWPAVGDHRRGAIVMLHRGHEHSGRMMHLVDELDLPEFAMFAWDARGHGRSPGRRGHSPSFGTSVRDVDDFVRHIGNHHGIATSDLAIVAQSVGAVLAAAWVMDYAPDIRCLSLASPAFRIKLYVPLARPALKVFRAVAGNFDIKSYVKPRMLTRDRERQKSYAADPLITSVISVDMLVGMEDAADRLVCNSQAIIAPTQLLISGSDGVVYRTPQDRFFCGLGSPIKDHVVYDGFRHDLLGEKDRHRPIGDLRRFLLTQFDARIETPSLLSAHRHGASQRQAAFLADSLATRSPQFAYWTLQRAALKAAGHLSHGIKVGFRDGFDSGSMLDYVYRNEASGEFGIGKWIDRAYLNTTGWCGIRMRKQNIEAALAEASALLQDSGRDVRILDIAAGLGRYVLDGIGHGGIRPKSVLLRDFSADNVAAGQALIGSQGLSDITDFEQGDAFDRQSLASISPNPTLVLVSGLYELFSDNDQVIASLDGLADCVKPGGFLIYTNQPWHPQLEYIARVLTSHRGGKPWVMRLRSQAEMDQLVAAVGFEKINQRIDEWGIFSVSVARRR